ncbi:MAG: hypothetical protein KC776_04945 [Myxococcales bacterium]|nr:hypothetical protein [Myxococcales bacterium]MCB9580902.1 hypothetical protein [Polyangiaceae bacterium]
MDPKGLLEDYAKRPSQKSWEWLRGVIAEAPEAEQPELIDAAATLLRDWPARLLDGSGRRDDRVLSIHQRWAREIPEDSSLWKLVRSYTLSNPAKLPAQPLSELCVSGFSDNSSAVDSLLAWPHLGSLEVLRIEKWSDDDAEPFRRLLSGLGSDRLRGLHLIDVSPEATAAAGDVLLTKAWPRMSALSLGPARIPSQTFQALLRALGPELRELSLSGRISRELVGFVFQLCPKLETLQAGFDAGALTALTEGPGPSPVKVLRALGGKLGAEDCSALAQHLPALESLELYNQPIGDAGFLALARSETPSRLRVLRLRYCDLEKQGLEAWARQDAAALAELDLTDNDELDAGAIVELCESPGAEHLRVLGLEARKLRAADFERIARSPALAGLRSLALRSANLDKKTLESLLDSPAADGLETLELSYASDGRRRLKDVRPFVNAKSLHRLRRLALVGQKLSYARGVVEDLAQSPYLKQLEELDLRENASEAPIDDDEIQELREAGLPRLREVESGAD